MKSRPCSKAKSEAASGYASADLGGYRPGARVQRGGTLILGADSVYFSVINIWEIAIKAALGRPDFRVDPANLRRGLLDNSYIEIPVTGVHAIAVGGLPPIHRDPFDRMLVAQATIEGLTLITADRTLASYPGPIRLVG